MILFSNASLVNSTQCQEQHCALSVCATATALRQQLQDAALRGQCCRVSGVSPQDVSCYATTHTVLPGGNVRTRGAGGSLSVNPTLRAQQIAEDRLASYGISSWKQISTACHPGSSDRREAYSPKEERQEEGHPP